MGKVSLNPGFKPKVKFPEFIPNDIGAMKNQAITDDTAAYQRSDEAFRARHPMVISAETGFQKQLKDEWTGNKEFLPQMQATSIQSGLEKATGSMGPLGVNIAQDSGTEADVAKHLGLDILGFQQLNRQNRMSDLASAEDIFPRRQIGMTGADTSMLSMVNTMGKNNQNSAKYANDFQLEQYNYLNDAQNRQAQTQQHNLGVMANAQKKAAVWSGIFNSLGGLVEAAGSAAGSGGMMG